MKVQIPDKLYFKIGEVGKLADVPPHVLRYWESEFSAIRPKRANSKQRLYRRADVDLILKLKVLLHERRYTIAGAKKFLDDGEEWHDEGHEKPQRHEDVSLTLGMIKEELQDLQKLLVGKGV
ncbi:MAG: MerR family transcriptional regulator [Desulfoprunum sp.]|nr:MerR family transcriptional regulator [Desulfoprunum sp.]